MSAGLDLALPTDARRYDRLDLLAPKFREAVEAALAECDALGLDAIVFETYRTDALQKVYYARGRSVKPPMRPVTNAMTALSSWHGYGLGVDVIHRELRWSAPTAWWHRVAAVFSQHGCDWGGLWTRPDLPHFQWGKCRSSPSDKARRLMKSGGTLAVWDAVGAI